MSAVPLKIQSWLSCTLAQTQFVASILCRQKIFLNLSECAVDLSVVVVVSGHPQPSWRTRHRPGTRERLQAIQLTSASLHSIVSAHTVPHLSPLTSACSCASTSCRSSSHCVSWLSESSTSVLSTFASSEHSLAPLSATRCMSSRHRGQLSVAVETAQTTRLALTSSIPRGNCLRSDEYRLHGTSRSARPKHSSSLQSNTCDTSCCISATAAKSFNFVGQLASNHTRCTVDRDDSRQNLKQPATLTLPPPRSRDETDRRFCCDPH